jgi:hypothetical protein
MGPATTMHMLFGAIVGWAILSPVAKMNGWAPGSVSDWETGSKGWIVWVSLAIMLADSVVNVGWLALRPTLVYGPQWLANVRERLHRGDIRSAIIPKAIYSRLHDPDTAVFSPFSARDSPHTLTNSNGSLKNQGEDISEPDAPPEHLVSNWVVSLGFIASIVFCIVGVHVAFYNMIPLWSTIVAILFSLVLSLMGVRALGETDLNPVSVSFLK